MTIPKGRHIPKGYDPKTPSLFSQRAEENVPAAQPFTPASMDALTRRLKELDAMSPNSHRRKDYLLETIALLDDLYPFHLSQDRYYHKLRPKVEDFAIEQRKIREAGNLDADMVRPDFRHDLAQISDALHKASVEMLAQANRDTLQEANAKDVASGNTSLLDFPAIARLALDRNVAPEAFHDRLIKAYKEDRVALRQQEPKSGHNALNTSNHSLDVLHMVRWGLAAAALEKHLHIKANSTSATDRLTLSNPRFAAPGGWADSVGRADEPPQR